MAPPPSSSVSPGRPAPARGRLHSGVRDMQEIRFILFAFALSFLVGEPARADRLDEVLADMNKAGKRLKTMTADFVQTDHDYLLKDQEDTRGKLYLAVPGRIRWEHAPPREKVLVVKDDLVRVYT